MAIKKVASILVIICLGLILASCGKEKETSLVEEVDLSSESKVIEAFGIIKAEESKNVIVDFPAVVTEVLVKEGQHMDFQESILTMDISLYQTQIQNETIELNIAMLEQQNILKRLQLLTADDKTSELEKLKNDLDFSQNLYLKEVENFKSIEKLFIEGAISQESYNLSKKSVDRAKNSVEDLEYELEMAIKSNARNIEQFQINKDTEKSQAEIQTEKINKIKHNIATLENKLNKSYIIGNQIVSDYKNAAIFDIKYTSGNITDTEQKAFTLVNLDSLIVEANVPEEFIKDVKVGESVRIVPIADRTKEYKGSVIFVSQMAFNSNGETVIPVSISINTIDSFLLPNYNVDVYIDVQ
jgi:multidrug efflux pump subunit AcrA (membrane-fusion protein)